MPTSASLVTNLPADFNTFGQAVDTSMSELLGGTTGQVLSKTSNTNMDFTWVTPTDQTPLTTKGDLFTFSTVDARLAVGTNGQTLVANSSTSTGLEWQTPASGSGLTLISTTSFSAVTSQSFNSVFTSTYTNYTIYLSMFSSSGAVVAMRFRASGTDNTSSNYYDVMRATSSSTGTATSDDNRSASNLIVLGSNQSTSSTVQSQQVLQIMSPFTTTTNKSMTIAYTKGDGSFGGEGWGVLAVPATAFDGFTIYSSAGGAATITGTASIYGWSK